MFSTLLKRDGSVFFYFNRVGSALAFSPNPSVSHLTNNLAKTVGFDIRLSLYVRSRHDTW